jgi:hypothetical protein
MIIIYSTLILLIILFVLAYIWVLHKALLKWLPYRWLINSIIFPYNLIKLIRTEHEDKFVIYTNWTVYPMWFNDYWFGRALIKYLENYIYMHEVK